MLHEIFYWLFNMSITATVTGAAVLLLRRIRRLPRRVTALLWLAPYLRMCLPLGLSSPYSLMSLLSGLTTRTVVVIRPGEDPAFTMMNSVMAANGYFPIHYRVNILEDVFALGGVVWLVVFLGLVLLWAGVYVAALREARAAIPGEGNVYYSPKVTSPAVYGILRPRILLPMEDQGRDLEFVLRHERAHIRRGDNLWRLVALFLTALHWFNPFAWVFLKAFLEDLELACDEQVLSSLDASQARAYARSLLDRQESDKLFVSAFGGARLRIRLERILSFRKMTLLSVIGSVLLLTTVFVVLLTNAME